MTCLRTNCIGATDGAGGDAWKRVASYSAYEAAQSAVDRLSDASFPVEHVEIVGRELSLVCSHRTRPSSWRELVLGLEKSLLSSEPRRRTAGSPVQSDPWLLAELQASGS